MSHIVKKPLGLVLEPKNLETGKVIYPYEKAVK